MHLSRDVHQESLQLLCKTTVTRQEDSMWLNKTANMRYQGAEERADLKAIAFGCCSLVQLIQEH